MPQRAASRFPPQMRRGGKGVASVWGVPAAGQIVSPSATTNLKGWGIHRAFCDVSAPSKSHTWHKAANDPEFSRVKRSHTMTGKSLTVELERAIGDENSIRRIPSAKRPANRKWPVSEIRSLHEFARSGGMVSWCDRALRLAARLSHERRSSFECRRKRQARDS